MQTVPRGVDPNDVKHDIEMVRLSSSSTIPTLIRGVQITGVLAVHELHIWCLNQQKSIASAHIVVSNETMAHFMDLANTINECFHAYGIHSATLQPELSVVAQVSAVDSPANGQDSDGLRRRTVDEVACILGCRDTFCEDLTCCG